MKVLTGLARFLAAPPKWASERRLGLLCNPASVNENFDHARDLIAGRLPGRITALFSPQHGFHAEKQDNMIESGHMTDPALKVPVFSLYSETRAPSAAMLDRIDALIIDLQDVGTRVYTFASTMSHCMEAAKARGKQVVVLDRPNPVAGVVEGNRLAADCRSFVGRYPIPMRHGLTMGELALMINDRFGVGCDLTVIPMKGWTRRMYFRDAGLPWVPPSPNMPTPETALAYPGQVLWEGTNVSEGRGTALPFEMFGAPFIDPDKILSHLGGNRLPGVMLRKVAFEPTSNKWQGRRCNGFQLHVTDPDAFRPYDASLRLLQAVLFHHRREFEWKAPPYEYEYERRPIDLIIGDGRIRRRLENMEDPEELASSWRDALDEDIAASRPFHLYPETGA